LGNLGSPFFAYKFAFSKVSCYTIKMAFTNLDEVATWMLSNIRLSRYDDQFVNNLTLYITQHGRITSNQHALFKRVASKYVRQFNHHKVNVNEIITLPWSVSVVESAPEHTSASIEIENDTIIFKSPYNKNFITAYRKTPIYSMLWHRDTRQYTLDYSPTVLRDLIYLSAEYYEVIRYCPITTDIIHKLGEYESVKYWVPTLTYVNGILCIKAINSYLYEAIKDIPINDDLKTIATLVKYGIKIDDSVINHLNETHDPLKVKFASQFHIEFELKEMSTAIQWLEELGCDAINHPKTPFMKNLFSLDGIEINIINNPNKLNNASNPAMIYYKGSLAMIDDKPSNLLKIVKCVNSEPVYLGPK